MGRINKTAKAIILYLIDFCNFVDMITNLNDDINRAVSVLKSGGLILYPTDTVWGIGCDATNSDAVKKVFALKKRFDHKALIVMLGNDNLLDRYVDEVPDAAEQLIDVATEPLTIIYDRGRNLAPELLGPDGSVGIRITSERVSRTLCNTFRRPLISTSANISGQPAPSTFAAISKEILSGVDYVMESRRDDTTQAKPSSIIKVSSDNTIKIIRK